MLHEMFCRQGLQAMHGMGPEARACALQSACWGAHSGVEMALFPD